MKKRSIIILTVLILFFQLIFCINAVYAEGVTSMFTGDSSSTVGSTAGEEIVTDVIGIILSALRIIAISISVIVLTYLGIKYMSAAPSEKAEIKRQLITFTIGVVVFVGSTKIIEIIRDYAVKIGK